MKGEYERMMMMIAPKSCTRRQGRRVGRWRGSMEAFEERRKECWLQGNGATQPATRSIMCKMGWVRFRHERFENGGSVWAGIPVEVTQEAGVVPGRKRAVIHRNTLLVASYDTQEVGKRILSSAYRGNLFWYANRKAYCLLIENKN